MSIISKKMPIKKIAALSILLAWTLLFVYIYKDRTQEVNPDVEVTIIADNWEFEPDVLRVKKGDLVRVHVVSKDVTHGFGIPAFGVSEYLFPGETITVEFIADLEGEHSFSCIVFCGGDGTGKHKHSTMRGVLIVEE